MKHEREERYNSYAKVVLTSQNNLGYLRDLNTKGCQVDFIDPPTIDKDKSAELQIIPNEEFGIPNFSFFLDVKWMRQEQIYYSVGGTVAMIPEEHKPAFENLLTYFKK